MTTRKTNDDWVVDKTTIDLDKLSRLSVYKPNPRRRISPHPGASCFLQPPGHPSYFIQSIYTLRGDNPPPHEPQRLLFGHVIPEPGPGASNHYDNRVLDDLYLRLPIDHPRVVEWIRQLFRHFHGCYQVPEDIDRDGIFCPGNWRCKRPRLMHSPSHRMTDAEYEAECLAVEQRNWEDAIRLRQFVTPERHMAVVEIRQWYPEFEPIELDGNFPVTTWWERFDRPPVAGEFCPGDRSVGYQHEDFACQFCGSLNLETP